MKAIPKETVNLVGYEKFEGTRMMVSLPHQRTRRDRQLTPYSVINIQHESGIPRARGVDLGFDGPIASYGLAHSDDSRILHVGRDTYHDSVLVDINPATLSAQNVRRLPNIVDPHSVCIFDGHLYVVSTGNDEVHRMPIDGNGMTEVVYKVPNSVGTDIHHLNSIVTTSDGRILVSGFGPKAGEEWNTAKNGFVIDIGTEEVLIEDVYHPHTLYQAETDIWVCESSRSSVLSIENGKVVIEAQNYTRGLAQDKLGNTFAGESSGKEHKNQPGVVRNADDPGVSTGAARISVFPTVGPTEPIVRFGRRIPELYDLILL